MALMNHKTTFQKIYQIKCGQVLNSLKMACTLPCSQGGYRVKGLTFNFPISAHSLNLEFKSFYRIWHFVKNGEKSSPILTTSAHHTDIAEVVRIGEDGVK